MRLRAWRWIHGAPLNAVAVTAFLLGLLPSIAAAQAQMPRATMIEKVACASDPTETYTLYLPAAYSPERRWPVLFIFDPRGRGTVAADVFRAGADAYGWVLASSDNTQSDGDWEPNARAVRAMWPDVQARVAADPRRLYAAGFSGGVGVAWLLGRDTGQLAGVIGSGGRHPRETTGSLSPFAFYGTAGRHDFNLREMKAIERTLSRRGRAHRLEHFEGRHQWLPPGLAAEAIGWLEIVAMVEGRRPPDPRLVEQVYGSELAAARSLEGSHPLEARHRYDVIVETFESLRNVDEVRAAAAALDRTPLLQTAVKDERRWDEFETKESERSMATLAALAGSELLVPVGSALTDLRISALRKEASRGGYEGDAAQRVLELIFVQTSFYIPRENQGVANSARAAFMLSIAAQVKPEATFVWYDLAAARARSGQKRDAIDALRRAVDTGFSDRARLEKDTDFDAIRKEKSFQELMVRMPATSGA